MSYNKNPNLCGKVGFFLWIQPALMAASCRGGEWAWTGAR